MVKRGIIKEISSENTIILKTEEKEKASIELIENSKYYFPKQKKTSKQRITVQISIDLIERIKNAVYWTPGLTLAALAENAFAKVVDELEEKVGKPFPQRKEELKTGRPIS